MQQCSHVRGCGVICNHAYFRDRIAFRSTEGGPQILQEKLDELAAQQYSELLKNEEAAKKRNATN